MQIIKISPMSFKIILTREDLLHHGIENIGDTSQPPEAFFSEIIQQTSLLCDSSFTDGTIWADFFESKDGGGELFLNVYRSHVFTTYLFSTDSIDCLFLLCSRIRQMNFNLESSLYCTNDTYSLLIFSNKKEDFLFSCMREYGVAREIEKINHWQIQEHQRELFPSKAIEQICFHFG